MLKILSEAKTIAVVGCSRDPAKPSHFVPKYLQEHGYKIIPVNPSADVILGEKAAKSLSDVKEKIDLVEIFRPSAECLQIVKDAIFIFPKPKAVWMQEGIINEEAAKLAMQNGISLVMDKCMMKEHKRLANY